MEVAGQGRDIDLRKQVVSGSSGTLKIVTGFGQAFLVFVTKGKEGQVVALRSSMLKWAVWTTK